MSGIGHAERHFIGSNLSDIILGGQDGLVNVLGLVLGVAGGTNSTSIVLIAGLAATFAETISMGAVAYTSSKADKEYYMKQLELERDEIKRIPEVEENEIRGIYHKKGFRGNLLNKVVNKITSNRKVWLNTMMTEELGLSSSPKINPLRNGMIVFISTLIGSIIPLVPFVLLSVQNAIITSLLLSVLVLFLVGVVKARLTVGSWFRSGFELSLIGTLAALSGYFIGLGLGNLFGTNVAAVG
ncbi:MAG: VIT1/CCC1 transporter family protein [Candidatus Aenigmarchaeota archaeon]|nr:VIT1/CCC1 transporter family protein [Candidatus Aenigmarchaeota archaeon]